MLPLCLAAVLSGFLGGVGGRFYALWTLRRELHALAASVDPKRLEELHTLAGDVAACLRKAEAAESAAKSL
ncbi:MAG TPA: hypothetical protein VFP15_06495, partial [Gemmatimonadaceae bacterium]|nr:hypothetical protein [Gemmatimonadaceae bacterium]